MSLRRWLFLSVLACLCLANLASAGEIHEAIARGDQAKVAELLRGDPQLVRSQADNPMRDYPLHTAAINNQVEIARILLDAGADLDCGDTDGSTPLHDAVLGRKREMTEFLLSKGADVKKRDRNGAYALSFAMSGGDSLIVRRVLDAGADLDFQDPVAGSTLLHTACSRGLFWLADRLLAQGADINARNKRGETPLSWACQGRFPQRVEMILARGADPTLADTSGVTPLQIASRNWNRQPEMVRMLLARGLDPNVADHYGSTPLQGAAARGDAEVVRMLLNAGAKVQVKNREGGTPLLSAASGGHAEVVGILLEAGAKTEDAEREFGWTPLHQAAAIGYRDVAKELLDHGADPNSKDGRGRTPLALAEQYGQTKLAAILQAKGARGDAQVAPVSLQSLSKMGPGEAEVWYLGHSSWALKTRNHFLVFDYGDIGQRSDEPNLNGGDINPAELAGERVTVFASHDHGDHYIPGIFDWRKQAPQINYVLGFRPQNLENNPSYEYIEPHQTRTIDGMKVTTLQSVDAGVGFLVEADGLTIFHPGDHANMQEDMSGPFKPEIDALVQKGARPDIAFTPLVGCGGGTQRAARLGAEYILETMQPKVLFPMHGGLYGKRYANFIDAINKDVSTQTKMLAALCKGDHFHYKRGEAS